jgi:hypothetical protein
MKAFSLILLKVMSKERESIKERKTHKAEISYFLSLYSDKKLETRKYQDALNEAARIFFNAKIYTHSVTEMQHLENPCKKNKVKRSPL